MNRHCPLLPPEQAPDPVAGGVRDGRLCGHRLQTLCAYLRLIFEFTATLTRGCSVLFDLKFLARLFCLLVQTFYQQIFEPCKAKLTFPFGK